MLITVLLGCTTAILVTARPNVDYSQFFPPFYSFSCCFSADVAEQFIYFEGQIKKKYKRV